jgi:hypothetical protein
VTCTWVSRQGASGGFCPVFVADVVPADKPGDAVHHHDLAVVAKLTWKRLSQPLRVANALTCTRRRAAIAHSVGQGVAADTVVEHIDGYAFGGFFLQQGCNADRVRRHE